MKKNPIKTRLLTIALTLAASLLLSPSANAQQSNGDTLFFNNGTGGSGTWQDGAGGTTWFDSANSTDVNWDNTVQTFGVFNNTPGNVTVSGPVSVNNLDFESSYTLTGGTITKNGDVFGPNNTDSTIATVDNNSNVTINDDIVVTTTQPTDQYDINNNGSGTVTYNGNITYTGTGAPGSSVLIDNAAAGSTTILNGAFTNSGSDRTTSIWIRGSNTGTLVLNGDYSALNTNGTFLAVQNGTAILGTSLTGTGTIGLGSFLTPVSLLTAGTQTIANPINIQTVDTSDGNPGAPVIVGGSTNTESTYSGQINLIVSGLEVTAVAGGRVNFTGAITNNTLNGIVKTGAGTVVLSSPNTYGLVSFANLDGVGTVAADLQAGTTLINNTTGSAFGNNSGVVNVHSGATLGGKGISTQAVVVAGGGIIAPGDAGQAFIDTPTTIATLNLTGGLSMASGAIMSFKLNGTSNDMISLGTGALTLAGTTNVNFTSLGSVQTWDPITGNHYYTLVTGTGSGTWTTSPTFDFTAPAGYRVDHVIYDPLGSSRVLEIEFAAVPEPSTYALMIGGLAFLAFCVRRKNRMV